ncbi:hypothetical protein BO94DRAFT_590162 [Aspergillus sclerotioniger CBS 115572]|uniref:Uncharacterized protein n=1 Tax=Aspergillus sclerotioniger CBS 115572 TaxID=1450535 RepID=A0A317VCQ1_9EURO|nr:hypothetical protein BO94DRAFT_590162 [Aspergillus sclerotioniger CBS 115572]PWY70847.1 hypothetical protein BO94DRAFT_590162 [Aspergillus sclerotioniger CBS 115572]
MITPNHGFSLTTLFVFLVFLFTGDAWARSPPLNARSAIPNTPAPPAALTKRSTGWQAYVEKGRDLACATEMSDAMAEIYFGGRSVVATYTTRAQLTANGWTLNPNPDRALDEKFEQYVGEELLTELDLDITNNVPVDWKHTVEIDDTHPATKASYQCWYNLPAGAIIVDLAWSPAFKVQEMVAQYQADLEEDPDEDWENPWPTGSELPSLRQLSDVMWIEWAARTSASNVEASSLKYIFQMNVVNVATRQVIEQAMNNVPAKDWVGYTDFDTNSEAGYALLGSPNGGAQAWLLINHKSALGADQSDENDITGLKTISKIRIWTNDFLCYVFDLDTDDDDPKSGYVPCYHMLFFVDTYSGPDYMDLS